MSRSAKERLEDSMDDAEVLEHLDQLHAEQLERIRAALPNLSGHELHEVIDQATRRMVALDVAANRVRGRTQPRPEKDYPRPAPTEQAEVGAMWAAFRQTNQSYDEFWDSMEGMCGRTKVMKNGVCACTLKQGHHDLCNYSEPVPPYAIAKEVTRE